MTRVLEIAENACIRWMRVDDCDLFSVIDCIKYVCPHNSMYMQAIWYRLVSKDSQSGQIANDMLPEFQTRKFEGKGQQNTPCATIPGLQKLLLVLGSKAAVEFRDRVIALGWHSSGSEVRFGLPVGL